MKKYKWYLCLLGVLIIIGGGWFYYHLEEEEEVEEPLLTFEIEEVEEEVIEEEPPPITYYYIDIKGAVKKPAVYKVVKGSRIFEAIELAGGLKQDADTSVLNLSKEVQDEMLIIIYTKREIKQFKAGLKTETVVAVQTEIATANECPDPVINQACANLGEEEIEAEPVVSGLVCINTALLTELQTLNGIGPAKAQDIINYRTEHGPFQTLEDLMLVKGIGESVFVKIKDNLTL